MRLLVLSFSFPPVEDPRSLRWYYLCRELCELGYQIDLVTIDHPGESKKDLNIEGLKIHRVFPGFFEYLSFSAKNKIGVDKSGNNDELRSNFFFSVAKSLYLKSRVFADFCLPGDLRTEWFPYLVNYLNSNLGPQDFDFLISSHEPAVDSLVAYYFKKRHPQIKWIGDFGDPHVAIYTPALKKPMERFFEKKIYQSCDRLIFTNPYVVSYLQNQYRNIPAEKFISIPQGYDQAFRGPKKKKRSNRLNMFYAGSFYESFRNPRELVKALESVDFDFRLEIAGRNEQYLPLFKSIREKVDYLGLLSHDDVMRKQSETDLLIYFSNDCLTQVPGKIYECIGSETPMLGIFYQEAGYDYELFDKYGLGFRAKQDQDSITEALKRFYKLNKINRSDSLSYKRPHEFSWQSRAKEFTAVLNEFSEK